MQKRLPGVVFVLLCFIWGSTFLAIKIGLNFLPPFLFAGLRIAVASIFLLFLAPILHVRMPKDRSSRVVMLFIGVVQITFVYGLVFWGEQYLSSGLTSVLSATFPLFVVLFAAPIVALILGWAVLHEQLEPPAAFGTALILAGVYGTVVGWRGR